MRFAAEPLARPPLLEGVLSIEGDGRLWAVIHNGASEQFRASLALHRGEVVQSREATLEEIFVARVGRVSSAAEAA